MSPLDTDFTPTCMSTEDFEGWKAINARLSTNRAPRPCDDCPIGYAIEMRADGCCNGTPSGADDDTEVFPMTEPTAIDVTVIAPCDRCAHAPVCRLRSAVEGTTEVTVGIGQVDPAISIELTAKVECEHFKRGNGSTKSPKPKREMTPEQLEAARERMARARAAQAEQRKATAS